MNKFLEGQYNYNPDNIEKSILHGIGPIDTAGRIGKNNISKGEKLDMAKKSFEKTAKDLKDKVSKYKKDIEYDLSHLDYENQIELIKNQISSYEETLDLLLGTLKDDQDFFDEVFPGEYKQGDIIPEDIPYNNDEGLQPTDTPIRMTRNYFRELKEKIIFLKNKKEEIDGTLGNLPIEETKEESVDVQIKKETA